jgi:DNA-binding CsgD family transcriptional regulator
MPDEKPEFPATVIAMRKEGRPEEEIARALGMTRKELWTKITNWNHTRKGTSRAIPRPVTRPKTPLYLQAIQRYEAGETTAQIAAALNISERNVRQKLGRADRAGLVAFKAGLRDKNGARLYQSYRDSKAAPPLGRGGTLLEGLNGEDILNMLKMLDRKDKTLMHFMARLLREKLNDTRGR